MDNGAAIMVRDLRKSYRDVTAVAGIDLDIGRGRGKLGVSGRTAAVTTAIERGLPPPPDQNR